MDAIKFEQVCSTYQGKDGCACGCGGKYTYTTAGRKAASKDRGYEVADNEVNDKRVAKIVKYINDRLDSAERHEGGAGMPDIYEVKRDGNEHYVYRAYVWPVGFGETPADVTKPCPEEPKAEDGPTASA